MVELEADIIYKRRLLKITFLSVTQGSFWVKEQNVLYGLFRHDHSSAICDFCDENVSIFYISVDQL